MHLQVHPTPTFMLNIASTQVHVHVHVLEMLRATCTCMHLHSVIKPSVAAVLEGSVAMENTVSQDGLMVVKRCGIRGLQLSGAGMALIKTQNKLCPLYHIKRATVDWF